MLICCLGWGSLVWEPKDLPIRSEWFKDGPFLPIEFTRQSSDGRITLVITDGMPFVRTLWSIMASGDMDYCVNALANRERISQNNIDIDIGIIRAGESVRNSNVKITNLILDWSSRLGIDAVIWTNLPPKFNGIKDVIPEPKQVVDYLNTLPSNKLLIAKKYILNTPNQIDTDYRRMIVQEMGW
jgi:hypothetical protein